MKEIKIKPIEIIYEPAEPSVYMQGIKGRKNYEHYEKGYIYNGCGGAIVTNHSTITVCGKFDGSDEERYIEIDPSSILDEFEREKFTEKFSKDLTDNLPEVITLVENKNKKIEISEESCKELYSNTHPRKAKKKYNK